MNNVIFRKVMPTEEGNFVGTGSFWHRTINLFVEIKDINMMSAIN